MRPVAGRVVVILPAQRMVGGKAWRRTLGVGTTVIATSSSDAKLERLGAIGVDHGINDRTTPAWGERARELTIGLGVDHVIEVGGPGTMEQSIIASRVGGRTATSARSDWRSDAAYDGITGASPSVIAAGTRRRRRAAAPR